MLKNFNEEMYEEDMRYICKLKSFITKLTNKNTTLEKQLTEREILIDEMAKEINERDIKNHKLERENSRYKESFRLIDLNESVCIKYKAKYNKARTASKQNRQAIRELLQDIDNFEFVTQDGKKFRDGDIKTFVEVLEGKCEMFSEDQCKILLDKQ